MKDEKKDKIFLHVKEMTALFLWEIGAIAINLEKPFKLASGNHSPIYINCRKVISHPTFMRLFTSFSQVLCQYSHITMDVVAGGETAGIPFAAYVAESFSLPLVYVRKKSKDYGLANLVEGQLEQKAKVLLVEDLITDAGSKLNFVKAVNAAGGLVTDILVLFDRQQGGEEALNAEGIRLHSLTNMDTALHVAEDAAPTEADRVKSVREYLLDAKKWHQVRGLEYLD
jgi:orotate phosphoribosyltransferase